MTYLPSVSTKSYCGDKHQDCVCYERARHYGPHKCACGYTWDEPEAPTEEAPSAFLSIEVTP